MPAASAATQESTDLLLPTLAFDAEMVGGEEKKEPDWFNDNLNAT